MRVPGVTVALNRPTRLGEVGGRPRRAREDARAPGRSRSRAREDARAPAWLRPCVALALALAVSTVALAQSPVAPETFERHAVVCQSPEAAAAGARIFERGGNAVDAAVAVAFAMAVTYPEAGNIGGGGFIVLFRPERPPRRRLLTTFDFREQAPAVADAGMFLDENGEYDARRHHEGHLSVGVPGSVAGLGLVHALHGELQWRDVVEPAVELAREGFPLPPELAASLAEVSERLQPPAYAASIFLPGGAPPAAGARLVQGDLADTLERIAAGGPEEFYRGRTARLLVAEMERGGGRITMEDLAAYRAVEREPVVGAYRGFTVAAMGPPSSGGVALVEMLNVLEGYDLAAAGPGSAAAVHLMAEAMRRAFADRARWLGDADQVEVPVARLTGKEHAAALRAGISTSRASASSPGTFEWPAEGSETTHISVVDGGGMAVALTTTLEQAFGSKILVPGAGFLLNNEMGDFNAAPGLTTAAGLIGTPPNLAAPRKRMLSSMTPAIVLERAAEASPRDGPGGDGPGEGRDAGRERLVAVLGSPGGRTIINSVLGVVVHLLDFDRNIQEAVDAPRVHHQWLPDVLWLEPGFSPDTARLLRERGHEVRIRDGPQGSVMAIARDRETGRLVVGRDRRRPGSAAAGR